MKQIRFLVLAIVCLSNCNKQTEEVTITGEIKGMATGTIYLYGMDETFDRIDTIFCENGTFTYTTEVDTITSAYLLINNQTEYPIFFDKRNHIKIKGTANNLEYLTIEGNPYNEEFTAFQKELQELENPSVETQEKKAEEFISNHHSSFVSLYLLDKYFVRKESPDFDKIKMLIDTMTGILQDKPYITHLNEYITQRERIDLTKYAPPFSLPNAEGKRISRSSEDFKQKNLLITFWASWGDSIENKRTNDELKAIYKKYKKNKYFNMLSISLDIDKKTWLDVIKRDTLEWEQVCNFCGLNAEILRQYPIRQIPTNFLLSPEGRILAKDLQGEELTKEVENAVKTTEEKEKNKKKNK